MVNKKSVAMVVAEFIGTALLTLVVLSVQGSAIGIAYFVAFAVGLAFSLMLLAVGSGWLVQLNPAVTLGLWTIRKIGTVQALANWLFQFLGAYGAYWLFTYFANNRLPNSGGHFSSRVMLAEAVGTFVFTFVLAAAVYQKYVGLRLAAAAGLAYVAGILVASSAAHGLLNPALALGTKSWSWGTYILGPAVGAIIGMNLYSLVFTDSALPKVSSSKASSKKK